MPKESKAKRRERTLEIHRCLRDEFPVALCALNHRNAFELLAATIISAQCTDERVNLVTPALFARFPDPASMADAQVEEIEDLVKTTGFFRNKAKNLQGMAKGIMERFAGKVPQTLEELVTLPGVGRKTANVVLGNCFGVPGLTVDTHMQRLNQRFGLTTEEDAEKIERELMELVPQPEWTVYSHRVILHGRKTCVARKPRCEECVLTDLCWHYQKSQNASAQKPTAAKARPSKK